MFNDKTNFNTATRMHSSRMRTARSSSRLLGGAGIPNPQVCPHWVRVWRPPRSGPGDPPCQLYPWCGPGDPFPQGQTPQFPPWVWAWRPPKARPLNFPLPPGCGPGDLQCMRGYHPPLWTETCNACWDTPLPLWTE